MVRNLKDDKILKVEKKKKKKNLYISINSSLPATSI